MNKTLNIFIAGAVIFMINSCNGNPFMNNLFSRIDKYELPSSFSSADDVLSEAGDDEFLEALAENPELTEIVIDLLDDVLDENPADADQEAAILLADVYLATTDGDETVNNVNDLLVDAMDDPDSLDFEEPEDIITDLFVVDPALSQGEQEVAVAAQLEAFLGAADAMEFYGDTMIAGQETSPEVNTGEAAATAMISGMTAYMIENAVVDSTADPVVAMTQDQAIAAITAAIVDPVNNDFPDTASNPAVDDAETTEDMFDAMLGPGLSEVVSDGFDLSSFDEGGE
jgi:hypothetical protein